MTSVDFPCMLSKSAAEHLTLPSPTPDGRCSAAGFAKMFSFYTIGWRYSRTFGGDFHIDEGGMDLVRRRRWQRKMVMVQQNGSLPLFQIPQPKGGITEVVPRIFLHFKSKCRFLSDIAVFSRKLVTTSALEWGKDRMTTNIPSVGS